MKYLITTLAVGESYLDNAIKCYTNLANKTTCDFNITTNVERENTSRLNFDYFKLDRYNDYGAGFSFYLNLKALSLKYALDKAYDYVIFNDADWNTTEKFSENNILGLFEYMENRDLDVLFERPANIGYYKEHYEECYFKEKMTDYNVLEHSMWDDAFVVNEQFFVFKVNAKFRFFVRRWESMMWYAIANNIRHYPDGFEIGISIHETGMKYDFEEWQNLVRENFYFHSKNNELYYRF